jgi:hypothetical protein
MPLIRRLTDLDLTADLLAAFDDRRWFSAQYRRTELRQTR